MSVTAAASVALTATLFSGSVSAAALSYPSGWVDTPAENTRVSGTSLAINGWALDAGATSGTGVDRVDVYLDGTLRGAATYGDNRPDMAAAYGARFASSGFHYQLDLSTIPAGNHSLEARAHSLVSGTTTAYPHAITVLKPTTFGANAHLMWYGVAHAIVDLDRIQYAGLHGVRFDLYWSSVEPSAKGHYDQAYLRKLDGVIAAAQARDIHPTISVLGTPAWARHNAGSIMTPPDRPADFADVMGMLAARYANVPGVAYEIWNEPNQGQFWDVPGGPNAAAYGELLRATYPRIKAAAPTATVLGGALAFNDLNYLRSMYTLGGAKGYFDALSIHPYTLTYAPSSTESPYHSFVLALQQMESTMASLGEPYKPMWITEVGWSTRQMSESTRASYFEQATSLLSSYPYVVAFDVYNLNQAEDQPDMGLTAADGQATTSWTRYTAAARQAQTD
jgi:hypothetical protein